MGKYLILIFFSTSTILKAQEFNSPGNQNSSLNYNEKIQVSHNSTFLLVGESLLFNVHCFNSFTNALSDLSTIAYVELINEESRPALQTRVELIGGIGAGDFFLPSSLVTGNYTLIVYTNWMRNFSSEYFYKSTITIINPFKKPSYQFIKNESETGIEFFPEGGQILSGTLNMIGYRIRNNGRHIPYTVRIVDDKGNSITESISTVDGTGIIMLSALPGRVYKAIVSDTEFLFFQNLPQAKEEGIGIHTVMSDEFLNVNLTYRGKPDTMSATLLIQNNGNEILKSAIKFTADTASVRIRNKTLPSGLSRIIILNSVNQVEGDRTIFIPDSQKQPRIELGKNNFKHREKVSLKINLEDSIGPTYLSVSVRKIDKRIHDAAFTNNIDFTSSDKLIDFQCLTDRRKEKTYRKSNELSGYQYLPEIRGATLNGTVTSLTGVPITNELIYLSIPSTNYLFLVSKTDSLGNFYFITNRIRHVTEAILQLAPVYKNEYQIKISNEFLDDYSEFVPPSLLIDSSFSELIKERSVFTQLENVYYTEKQDSIILGNESTRFYGPPDKSYLLDNYVRFPTMEDVFIEYIPEISLRKKGELYTIKVVNFKNGVAFSEDPLILLDGIPIFDHNQIINLNPLLIKQIEIIKKRYFYGPIDVSGIISLETYKGDGMNVPFKDYTIKEMIGIQPKKIYYKPDYTLDARRIPDFRIQLYWEPSMLVNRSQTSLVEFYTSDVDGDFEISIVGFNQEGNRISFKKIITVSQNKN